MQSALMDSTPSSVMATTPYSEIGSPRSTTTMQGRKVSFLMSVFNLSNAIMGSGILGLPFVCAHVGILVFAVLLCTMAVVVGYSLYLLVELARTTSQRSYEALGAHAFGRRGRKFVGCMICTQNTGAMVSYMVVIGDLLPDLLKDAGVSDDVITNRQLLMVLVAFVVVLPVALLREISFIGIASGLSFTCMVLFTIVVVVRKSDIGCDDAHACDASLGRVSDQLFLALPTLCFSFVCHTALLPVFDELHVGDQLARTQRNANRILWVALVSISVATVLYLLTSVFGFLTFGTNVDKDLLLSYVDWNSTDGLVLTVRVCFVLAVTLTVPLLCFPFRKAFQEVVFDTAEYHKRRHVAVTVGAVTMVLVLALWVPAITTVFGLVGSTSSVTLVFILPAAMYLRIMGDAASVHLVLSRVMLVVGVVMGVVSLSGLLLTWITKGFHS